MNKIEKLMIDVLHDLKENHGVFEIKAEFEAEASRMDELMRLKDVISAVDLPLLMKIGGVEAITDIYMGLSLGVKGIVAPMAESAFAVSKFLNAIKTYIPKDNAEDIEFGVNIETKQAYDNIDEILQLDDINLLTGITVGRVDFVLSHGLERSDIESDLITSKTEEIFTKSKKKGLRTALGGGIAVGAIDNIKYFYEKGLINKFETRKVVFNPDKIKDFRAAILGAVSFEYLWLVSKRRYYGYVKAEDEKRIEMIESRMTAEDHQLPQV